MWLYRCFCNLGAVKAKEFVLLSLNMFQIWPCSDTFMWLGFGYLSVPKKIRRSRTSKLKSGVLPYAHVVGKIEDVRPLMALPWEAEGNCQAGQQHARLAAPLLPRKWAVGYCYLWSSQLWPGERYHYILLLPQQQQHIRLFGFPGVQHGLKK